jgi:hypothetical protein
MRKQYLSTILGNKRRFGETVFPYDEILARSNKKNIYVAASQPCHGEKKIKNIQQRGFASGHPPNY